MYVSDMGMDFMLFGATRTDKALLGVSLYLNYPILSKSIPGSSNSLSERPEA